ALIGCLGDIMMKNILKKIGGVVLGLTFLAGALVAPAAGQRVFFTPGRRMYVYHGVPYAVVVHRSPGRYRWSSRRGRWVRTRRW
ncbi:MAG TPA: hypothetical protein VKJ45_25835, partial [Blastocatellia bacterium]|nr:hypothetical protein [Blastocatellia bacterium]